MITMRFRRAADYLGLERNVAVVSAVVFLLGFGEELWKRYLPKYLEALGAGVGIVGLFGTTKDFFDAIYQYPGGWLADRVGRKPFVVATFVCFALFPVTVVLAPGFVWLIPAFVVGGRREIGEPSRKAMIVDFAEPHLWARTVGLYYLVRSLTITPAAALGGLLWKVEPRAPFIIAGAIGIVGTIVFAATVEERYAS
jgi:MFS family permease